MTITPDDLCLVLLAEQAISVDPSAGTAYTHRRGNEAQHLGCKNCGGYIVATLHHRGIRKQIKLHRLIWLAVNGPIPVGYVPDHINRVRHDNRIDNLRLVNPAENARNRRSYAGANNPSARLTQDTAEAIRYASGSYMVRARRFGVSKSLVAQISRGLLWGTR